MLDLDELERLEKAATAGPWYATRETDDSDSIERWYVANHPQCGDDPQRGYALARVGPVANPDSAPDAAFIAELRNALPDLVAIANAARWIPCSEAMPEEREAVLTWLQFIDAAFPVMATYEGGDWWWSGSRVAPGQVTHWKRIEAPE